MSDLTSNQLQHIFNQFSGFEGVTVADKDGAVLMPNRRPAIISGAIMVYGKPYAYELEVDLNEFKNADDVMRCMGKLRKSFDSVANNPQAL